jgi:hypothetical protein
MAAVLVTQDEALDPLTAARRVNRCGQVQTHLQKKAIVSQVLFQFQLSFQSLSLFSTCVEKTGAFIICLTVGA